MPATLFVARNKFSIEQANKCGPEGLHVDRIAACFRMNLHFRACEASMGTNDEEEDFNSAFRAKRPFGLRGPAFFLPGDSEPHYLGDPDMPPASATRYFERPVNLGFARHKRGPR